MTAEEAKLKKVVRDALEDHPKLDAGDIEVEVKGEEVTLKGFVDTEVEKHLAEKIAVSTYGVKLAHNQLEVKPGLTHTLVEIATMLSSDPDSPKKEK